MLKLLLGIMIGIAVTAAALFFWKKNKLKFTKDVSDVKDNVIYLFKTAKEKTTDQLKKL